METAKQGVDFVQKIQNVFDAQKMHQYVIAQTSVEQRIEKQLGHASQRDSLLASTNMLLRALRRRFAQFQASHG